MSFLLAVMFGFLSILVLGVFDYERDHHDSFGAGPRDSARVIRRDGRKK